MTTRSLSNCFLPVSGNVTARSSRYRVGSLRFGIACVAVVFPASCSGVDTTSDTTSANCAPLVRGSRVEDRFSDAVIPILVNESYECTGVAVSDSAILSVEHCVERTGTLSVPSVFMVDNAASSELVKAMSYDDGDLVLLKTASKLVAPKNGFPLILISGTFTQFETVSYGYGSYVVDRIECTSLEGTIPLSGLFKVDWQDRDVFGAIVTPNGTAVCAGDSGAPAFLRINQFTLLAGLLTESYASEGSLCTPHGGHQFWRRISVFAEDISKELGGCSKQVVGDYVTLSCS